MGHPRRPCSRGSPTAANSLPNRAPVVAFQSGCVSDVTAPLRAPDQVITQKPWVGELTPQVATVRTQPLYITPVHSMSLLETVQTATTNLYLFLQAVAEIMMAALLTPSADAATNLGASCSAARSSAGLVRSTARRPVPLKQMLCRDAPGATIIAQNAIVKRMCAAIAAGPPPERR